MEMTGWIVPTVFWIFVAAVVLGPIYFRSKERRAFYDTVRDAWERGAPVAPELVAAMKSAMPAGADIPSVERDLRTGLILLAAGLGMTGLGYGLWYGLMGVDELSAWTSGGWVGGVGAIVALIGLLYLAFWAARRGRSR